MGERVKHSMCTMSSRFQDPIWCTYTLVALCLLQVVPTCTHVPTIFCICILHTEIEWNIWGGFSIDDVGYTWCNVPAACVPAAPACPAQLPVAAIVCLLPPKRPVSPGEDKDKIIETFRKMTTRMLLRYECDADTFT